MEALKLLKALGDDDVAEAFLGGNAKGYLAERQPNADANRAIDIASRARTLKMLWESRA